MSQKNIRWLLEEIPTLITEEILPGDVAERLRRHYGDKQQGRGIGWAVVLFSILGALLIGGGIILLLAHNWEQLSRPVRTVLSFAPLVCAQVLGGWVSWKRRDRTGWREGAGTLLTLTIGSTIALIGQTYNIAGDFGSFMLTWSLLALPVVYLLDASVPAVLYVAGIVAWVADARFSVGQPLWFWLLTALLVPYLWLTSRVNRYGMRHVLVSWALALALCIGAGFTLTRDLGETWMLVYSGVFAVLYLLGERWFGDAASWWQRPFQTLGACGVFGLSLLLTFRWPWHEVVVPWHGNPEAMPLAIAVGWPLAAVALWLMSLRRRQLAEVLFGALPLIVAVGYLTAGHERGVIPATILMDIYLFILGVGTLWRGVREQQLGVVNGGMLMLSTLIALRFFDGDFSFVIRGLVFMAVGVGFLMTNLILIRRKRSNGMNKKLRLGCYLMTALAQVAVPANMIWGLTGPDAGPNLHIPHTTGGSLRRV